MTPAARLIPLLALALLALAACGTADDPNRIIIGISLPTQREEHWVRDGKKMREVAAAHGAEVKMQFCDCDAARQLAQCENLLASGIDALILSPHDAAAAAVIVEKAHAVGVKVISYDRLILHANVDLYLSFDNFRIGELQGEYLAAHAPKGNYACFGGAPTDNNSYMFKDGAMSVIKRLVAQGDVKVVMEQWITDWQPAVAQNLMENALTANHNNIQGVLAPNDNTAGGIIQALRAQGLVGKVVVTGQDADLPAAQRIVKGTQSMTIFKDTRRLATRSVELAVAMARGESIPTEKTLNNQRYEIPAILLDAMAVDQTNIDTELIGSGWFTHEEVYR